MTTAYDMLKAERDEWLRLKSLRNNPNAMNMEKVNKRAEYKRDGKTGAVIEYRTVRAKAPSASYVINK